MAIIYIVIDIGQVRVLIKPIRSVGSWGYLEGKFFFILFQYQGNKSKDTKRETIP